MRKVLGVLALTVASAARAADAVPLVEAVQAGDAATVRALLRRQPAAVNTAAADGMTALHWAVRANDDAGPVPAARQADVKAANRYGMTPLALAAQNGSAEVIELLPRPVPKSNTASPDGQTPLMTAARTGSAPAIKALVGARRRPSTCRTRDG